MPLQPGIYEDEEGERTLPFGDDENTPFTSTSLNGNGERDSPGVSSPPKINFTNADLGNAYVPVGSTVEQHSRVLMASGSHAISWTQAADGIVVKNASWMANGAELQNTAKQPQYPEGLTQGNLRLATNSVELPLESIKSSLRQYNGTDMHIRVYWEMYGGKRDDAVQTGYTQSGLFTVYDGEIEDETYWRLAKAIDEKKKNDPREESGANDVDWAATPSSTSATSAIGTPTAAVNPPTETNSIEAGSNSSRGGGGGKGGGGSGLSAGAIAGIVVGAVVGLALVAFLLWFFLRRLRRRRANHVHNGRYGSGPHAYLADKETHHARVTESPHSPYSDDGQRLQQQMQQSQRHLTEPDHEAALPVSADSPTEQHHQRQRSFAPYDEEEHSPITSHTPVATRSVDNVILDGPRSSTPNFNSNVSHLIEDGMTEDEIRRLEEEERALDAAIEQAGQGGQGQQQQQQQQPPPPPRR